MAIGQRLDSTILEVFSNLRILWSCNLKLLRVWLHCVFNKQVLVSYTEVSVIIFEIVLRYVPRALLPVIMSKNNPGAA